MVLLVDSSLLLVFVVGTFRRALVGHHKRKKEYTPEDYDLLKQLLTMDDVKILATPNVFTEVSDLLGYGAGKDGRELQKALGRLVTAVDEQYVESRRVSRHDSFPGLGIADTAMLLLLEAGHELLTVDFDLFQAAQSLGFRATNFNHLR